MTGLPTIPEAMTSGALAPSRNERIYGSRHSKGRRSLAIILTAREDIDAEDAILALASAPLRMTASAAAAWSARIVTAYPFSLGARHGH